MASDVDEDWGRRAAQQAKDYQKMVREYVEEHGEYPGAWEGPPPWRA